MRAVSAALVSVAGSILMVAATAPNLMEYPTRFLMASGAAILLLGGFVVWLVAYLGDRGRD
jgi:hypothetical protein